MSISAIILGLALVFAGKYFLYNDLIFSIGLGSLIGGLITYIPNRNVYKKSSYRKNFEQTYDERFIEISQKASGLAINIIFVLIGVSAFISYIFPIPAYKLCVILVILGLIIQYLCYEYYKHKYEDEEETSESDNIRNNEFSIKKIISILSIVIVFVGTLFSFNIANIYIGSLFIKQIGIPDTLYFKIIDAAITLGFLALGDYISKKEYPKLNKILHRIFGYMVLVSIILIFLNPFFHDVVNMRL